MTGNYKIHGVNGPVVTVSGKTALSMNEMVFVGEKRLLAEVIRVDEKKAIIQVYEETGGLRPGEPVEPTGAPMSIALGPGLLSGIFDGVANPLKVIAEKSGAFIPAGIQAESLGDKLWDVTLRVKKGDKVSPGQIFAECSETGAIVHKSMIPPDVSGVVESVKPDGSYTVNEVLCVVTDDRLNEHEIRLQHRWPIKKPRPVARRLSLTKPLVTGQRVVDTFFPIAKGGAAAIPGGFGTGKTMMQHQLAKWCDADIIIYIGCGERGNEMTNALAEFSELIDPKTGRPLMDRTVLIANTSNMPVAAREASIYTGITMAEYYRDMGYNVAMMADSTSRWAEAMREISGRLEEMPADEGFPAYLPSRLSEFYERAGCTENLNGTEGSVSVIGAVSPQGADFSEPVTQNTKRFTRCFWALDKSLAYARHYPAINWNDSYSEYVGDLSDWYSSEVGEDFMACRTELFSILAAETGLMEIVKLIGSDVLPDDQKLTIETARVIRVGFLQQNAFHKDDTYVEPLKQLKMMRVILYLHHKCRDIIARQIPISEILKKGLFDKLVQMKYDIPNTRLEKFDEYYRLIDASLSELS
ncbi:MAG: V-type ATP synthase subunit A [Clostridia bacterium]|nr:V-type ATP synthase subunit A [Clostridia bacterium]